MQLSLSKEKQTSKLNALRTRRGNDNLSSPSGAGKTTLVKKLSEKDNFEISISHTTRQPRHNENQNEDYFFVDELEFKRLIKNEEFLEYAKVFNNFYGTTRTPVIDKKVLFERLSKRHASDKLIAKERMKQFERDVLHWINYDYVVINNDLNECYYKITNLIDAVVNDGSKDYDPEYIRSHVEKLTS